MPPRFVFWTIILDGQPTAFRAAEREQLLPTLKQLQAKNPSAVLKWFAHGRVWESPEELWQLRAKARADARDAAVKKRGRSWRPGGDHKDPREKFKRETFQARKRRDKKAANLAAGAARASRPPGAGASRAPAPPRPEPPAAPGRPAPSHKTRAPRLRKPR
jgi:hypothetical protein